jgi:hypothetical protein
VLEFLAGTSIAGGGATRSFAVHPHAGVLLGVHGLADRSIVSTTRSWSS